MSRKSLFVLSLPRSLSSDVYHAVRGALDLQQPIWTSDGEILNNDRSVLCSAQAADGGVKFTRARETWKFQRVSDFLGQVTLAEGFAYKDVVQPFVVSAWLKTRSFPVLKIRRGVADVAYAMIRRNWLYPGRAFPESHFHQAMLRGLSEAWQAIDRVPGETVDFDDLITTDGILDQAIRALYPDARPALEGFRDADFLRRRDEVLKRRESSLYRELEDHARELDPGDEPLHSSRSARAGEVRAIFQAG